MYLILFLTAFVSATVWPLASEAVFLSYLHQNSDALLSLIAVATIGNTLGAVLMYELARQVRVSARLKGDRKQQLERWQVRLNRWGSPLLMLAWLPVIGDLLPIAAGILRTQRRKVVIFLALGKGARYLALAGVWVGLGSFG